jgi:hypothetical protein
MGLTDGSRISDRLNRSTDGVNSQGFWKIDMAAALALIRIMVGHLFPPEGEPGLGTCAVVGIPSTICLHALLHSSRPSSPRVIRCHPQCGPFDDHGAVLNLLHTDWRLAVHLPIGQEERFSLTIILSNLQRIEGLDVAVRWPNGQRFAVKNVAI